MDIVVTPSPDGTVYRLTDRLGRLVGEIVKDPRLGFRIRPESGGVLDGLGRRMVSTLDDAMAVIAMHTKGTCQLSSGDKPE